MKEFENWYHNEPEDIHLWSPKEIARIGWEAALEWIRDNREMKAWDDIDDMIDKEFKE